MRWLHFFDAWVSRGLVAAAVIFTPLQSSYAAPVVTSLNPSGDYVSGGATVTIIGTAFTGATAVKFGTDAVPFTVDSARKITVTAPEHAAGIVAVRVTTADGTSAADAASKFKYDPLPTVTSLYRFRGGNNDLKRPGGWLIADKAGNLYGTASQGGPTNQGGIFMLSPPVAPDTAWTRTILHFFDGTNGATPVAGLAIDRRGRLYGTTLSGGLPDFAGLVFRLTPPAESTRAAGWTYEVLRRFVTATDGTTAYGGVVLDNDGNVYGITRDSNDGGGLGFIYKLTPVATPPWPKKNMYQFTGMPAASMAQGRLVIDADGAIWGASMEGGRSNLGAVFKYTPPTDSSRPRPLILYSFRSTRGDGQNPGFGGLLIDADGNVYGTTKNGGANSLGAVFRLTPTIDSAYSESVIYSLGSDDSGILPQHGLSPGRNGTLLGTTSNTGIGGTVFKLSPPPSGQSKWTSRNLYQFADDDPKGSFPNSDLLIRNGIIYGMAARGGNPTCDCGTVFMIQE